MGLLDGETDGETFGEIRGILVCLDAVTGEGEGTGETAVTGEGTEERDGGAE